MAVYAIANMIKEYLKYNETADVEVIIKEAEVYDITEAEARRIIDELLRRGKIYEKEHGQVKLVEGD